MEFAELIGDVSKTLASKANIVGYDAKDDPFSDQLQLGQLEPR